MVSVNVTRFRFRFRSRSLFPFLFFSSKSNQPNRTNQTSPTLTNSNKSFTTAITITITIALHSYSTPAMWTRIGLRPTSTVTRHPTDAPFITRLAQSTLNQHRLSYTPSHHIHTHSVCLHAHSSCTGVHPLASSVSTSTSASTSGSSVRSPPILAPGQMPPADHPNLPGWYQRPLPQYLIPFSSNRGKQIFKEAMNNGGMEGYFALAEQFQTQSTPSCKKQKGRHATQLRGDVRLIGTHCFSSLLSFALLFSLSPHFRLRPWHSRDGSQCTCTRPQAPVEG